MEIEGTFNQTTEPKEANDNYETRIPLDQSGNMLSPWHKRNMSLRIIPEGKKAVRIWQICFIEQGKPIENPRISLCQCALDRIAGKSITYNNNENYNQQHRDELALFSAIGKN